MRGKRTCSRVRVCLSVGGGSRRRLQNKVDTRTRDQTNLILSKSGQAGGLTSQPLIR